MEACVDLYRGPRTLPRQSTVNQWWVLASGLVACQGRVPLPDSSEAHRCVSGLTYLTLCVPV
jgi:hypothetical protein